MTKKHNITANDISDTFEEIGELLDILGENVFKVRAYLNGARLLKNISEPLEEFLAKAKEHKIKGFGEALTEKATELYQTGVLAYLKELHTKVPPSLLELLQIPSLGAKKVKILRDQLGITNISELEKACQEDKLLDLKGFGGKTQEKILHGIKAHREYSKQFLLPEAFSCAKIICDSLRKSPLCKEIEITGSLRRFKETVKDIDLVATSSKPEELIELFTELPIVKTISSKGETKSSVVLENSLAVDLRVVKDNEFAPTLMYFTGSKEHNTALRGVAQKKDLKLNEYGLFKDETPLTTKTEDEIYKHLGLVFVPPEMREGQGEIETAAKLFSVKSNFPTLISTEDIKGILHSHSTYSDGQDSLRDLASALKKQGFQYLGITDHSKSAAYARGLSLQEIKRQHQEIEELNKELKPFKIFKGIESDILADGSLDYDDKILKTFDFVIISVHSRFNMDEHQMTERMIKAIENPYTTILGHPTGRLLLQREGYAVDVFKLLDAAAKNGVVVEINSNPKRLDLDWRYLKRARELNLTLAVCPDAHSIAGAENIKYGVGIARKGGLTKEQILTAWDLKQIERFFWSVKKNTKMDLKTKAKIVFAKLRKLHPNAQIELNFENPAELLVATVLSAQCTDVRVNQVTSTLFKKFKRPEDYFKRPASELEKIIRSTGFFRQKGKSIRKAMEIIVSEHQGKVPQSMEELTKLPGVGRKTANVILGNAFNIPGLPVDTHVIRISNRIGLTKQKDPVKIEAELCKLIPKKNWTLFSHTLIFHGRRVCKARKPLCERCNIKGLCLFYKTEAE